MRRCQPGSRVEKARGLQRVFLFVPEDCVESLRRLGYELRTRHRAGAAGLMLGWRRLSPSAELMVDPESGARCAIRDTRVVGSSRYHWTVSMLGDADLLASGRTGELAKARSEAEAVLAAYLADWGRALG